MSDAILLICVVLGYAAVWSFADKCASVAKCPQRAQPFANWTFLEQELGELFKGLSDGRSSNDKAMLERLNVLADRFASDADIALDCPMGAASVFFRLASHYLSLGLPQRAHNMHQLAMAFLWDFTRRPGGLECLEESNSVLWGINWDDFMNQYLSLAALLRRHEDDGLPPPLGVPVSYRNRSLRIGIASTCDYKEGSVLHGIDRISLENRRAYSALHGYHVEFRTDNHIPSRHPVWSAVSLPLEMLDSGKFDWVLSMDCDCLFINMTVTLEHMLYRQGGLAGPQGPQLDPNVHFLISEDGRGLAGGSWMIRNSDWSRSFLRSVLGPLDEVHPYDRHDLKDQFALLWHVLRPLATTREVPEPTRTEFTDVRVAGWPELQYIPEVRLIPQRLINAYPWALCRPSHHCFQDDEDFIVSFITLSSQSREMAFAMLNKFRAQAMSNYDLSAH